MSMFNTGDILETIEMFTQDNLDVRTVTMGISLLDCIDPDPKKACENIYNKITTKAANLVPTVEHISAEYGIPIINKRISVTPIAMLLGACPDADPVEFAKTLDAAGKKVGVNFVGGYSALVHKGFSAGDRRLIESIPRALAETDIVCSSVNIGATKAGLNMDAVKLMGEAVKKASELTADRQCIGAAKLVVFCNAPEDNPFMAGAFHGPGEPDCEIHVGVSGPGAVRAALARLPKDAPIDEVAELVKRTAFKITRVGQLVANLASQALGVPAGIIDLSLAPTPAIGDSVANILEEMGLETCGCCGTTACLALLNDAVKKGGVMASNHVGGLSGAFIPVSEDAGMIHAAETGCLTIEKLEAMTAVCSVGIDMVIIPGDTTPAVISALIADEAAIGMVNSKTTAVRVIPAIGDSVANILEEMGLETCGCCGTTACLALLNDAVKKGGVMASNHVGGLSGAFIPVSEDAGMIHAAEIGCLTIEKLEAMTAVCSVGIDMVIIPGDTTPAVISALIADEAAIGMVNSKTTAVRVIPAIGRKAGEVLDFGGLLGYGPIMAVNQHDPSVFINRGGRLPAPMQSLKN